METAASTTPARVRPLRAYVLRYRNGYDEPCALVYANTAREAHRQYQVIDGAEFILTSATRAPEFDGYPRGPTTSDLFEKHGWWFTCDGCGDLVRRSRHPEATVLGDNRWEPRVCCGPKCAEGAPARAAQRAARETRADVVLGELVAEL